PGDSHSINPIDTKTPQDEDARASHESVTKDETAETFPVGSLPDLNISLDNNDSVVDSADTTHQESDRAGRPLTIQLSPTKSENSAPSVVATTKEENVAFYDNRDHHHHHHHHHAHGTYTQEVNQESNNRQEEEKEAEAAVAQTPESEQTDEAAAAMESSDCNETSDDSSTLSPTSM